MWKDLVKPTVSVVIPTYNRMSDLRRCLDSLVGQSFRDFEVLVCDDGSTDDTASVAAEFADRLDLVYETAENFGGPARPRNRGLARARAPYVAFLDSDDWWMPEKLARSVAALNAGADVAYHDLFIVRDGESSSGFERLHATPPRHPMFRALLCTGISIPNSSVVVRRELLERIGGISENRDLVSVEDYDTWIRLSRVTEKFVHIPAVLGYYWAGGANISTASPKQLLRIRALYAQYLDALPESERSVAVGFLAYRLGRIAFAYGDKATARPEFRKALASQVAWSFRLKATLRFLQAAF